MTAGQYGDAQTWSKSHLRAFRLYGSDCFSGSEEPGGALQDASSRQKADAKAIRWSKPTYPDVKAQFFDPSDC